MSTTANKPVLSYAEYLAEKINPNLNLDALKVKGKSVSKEVNPELESLPKGKGTKVTKEVNPEIKKLPTGGKKTSKEVSSDLSNLKPAEGGKKLKAELDPKFATMPNAIAKASSKK